MLRFGVHVPNFGEYGDPRVLADLAAATEAAGWEGFFVWDHILFDRDEPQPVADPWIALAAAAFRTQRIRLGALVTPIARRRPWKLARETVSLDLLSDGRLIFGAALGFPRDAEFEIFGEDGDDRVRAEKLDEGLEVLRGLWSAAPYTVAGSRYQIDGATFLPPPLQSPSIPVWIGGNWPNKRPFRRAARWDGVMPEKVGGQLLTPDEIREIVAYVVGHRGQHAPPIEVVFGGYSRDPDTGAEVAAEYAAAGVTWWVERLHHWRGTLADTIARIRSGPPRVN